MCLCVCVCVCVCVCLGEAKAFAAFGDGKDEVLTEALQGGVVGEVNLVEAVCVCVCVCVCLWM